MGCFEACVAWVVKCDDVPADGWQSLRRWLAERGWVMAFGRDDGLAISSRRVRDGSIHAVVCRDGRVIYDPAGRPFARDTDPVLLWTQLRRGTCGGGLSL